VCNNATWAIGEISIKLGKFSDDIQKTMWSSEYILHQILCGYVKFVISCNSYFTGAEQRLKI
jgi:hypothetical protein